MREHVNLDLSKHTKIILAGLSVSLILKEETRVLKGKHARTSS